MKLRVEPAVVPEETESTEGAAPGVKVTVGVGESVGGRGVFDGVGVLLGVGLGPGVFVPVAVGVSLGVGVGPGVLVCVGVGVGPRVTQLALPASVKVCPAIGTNSQS